MAHYKTVVCSAFGITVAAMFGGCASSLKTGSEILLPEIDIIQVKENSDEALKLSQEIKLEVELINTKITELDNRISLLSEEVSDVSLAKIEEIENRLTLLVEAYKDLQAKVQMNESSPRTQSAKQGAGATFSPAAANAILQPSTEYEAYHGAMRVYNSRNYQKALTLFTETVTTYPKGTYADNCYFWIGKCHYSLGDHAAAIGSFSQVFNFPNSSKADDAQFTIGLCYLKMGKYGTARGELQKLIDRYPGSEYVDRARKHLAEMK